MQSTKSFCEAVLAKLLVALFVAIAPGAALAQSKPNIVFIMGDDIGMWNIGAYHRGLMAGVITSYSIHYTKLYDHVRVQA